MYGGRSRSLIILMLAFLSGCESTKQAAQVPATSGRVLTSFATVRLNDLDTAYIAKSNALAVSAIGDFFVTDMSSRRILRFDAAGTFVEAMVAKEADRMSLKVHLG
jgi:hypothetical protein